MYGEAAMFEQDRSWVACWSAWCASWLTLIIAGTNYSPGGLDQ